MFYPKINSLYKREGCGPFDSNAKRYVSDLQGKPRKSPLIIGEFACEEFTSIKRWTITEKVDGTNIRIIFDRSKSASGLPAITFGGRTDNAQIPTFLLRHLQETFTEEKMDKVFEASQYCVLFGEGYGGKIQSGNYYRKDYSFCLFDVYCSGWWMKRDGVIDVANQLNIVTAPIIWNGNSADWNVNQIVEYVRSKPDSIIASEKHVMEGVIARSEPVMMFREGTPVMFKLKCSDFLGEV